MNFPTTTTSEFESSRDMLPSEAPSDESAARKTGVAYCNVLKSIARFGEERMITAAAVSRKGTQLTKRKALFHTKLASSSKASELP